MAGAPANKGPKGERIAPGLLAVSASSSGDSGHYPEPSVVLLGRG